jgi:hypothetical protein
MLGKNEARSSDSALVCLFQRVPPAPNKVKQFFFLMRQQSKVLEDDITGDGRESSQPEEKFSRAA